MVRWLLWDVPGLGDKFDVWRWGATSNCLRCIRSAICYNVSPLTSSGGAGKLGEQHSQRLCRRLCQASRKNWYPTSAPGGDLSAGEGH